MINHAQQHAPPSATRTNRVALVTGATGGIGLATAHALARLGATVYVTGRDERRGAAAVHEIRTSAHHDQVHFLRADASTVGSNQHLAQDICAHTDRLHILVNNVGGLYNDRWETDDSYEASLAMNYVGPATLTLALLPLLKQSTPARIVNVVSAAHTMWKRDPFTDLHATQAYLGLHAYARAKLLNLVWTFALARRIAGTGVVINATNPGMAWTAQTENLQPHSMPGWGRRMWPLFRLIQRRGSAKKAARAPTFLASAPAAAAFNGTYVESHARQHQPAPIALDHATQEQAWALAQTLVAQAPTRLEHHKHGPSPSAMEER